MLECSTTQDPSTSTTPQVPLGIEPPDFEVKFTLKGHLKAISVVKLSPDGKWIASGSSDTVISFYLHLSNHLLKNVYFSFKKSF
ncbi:hypothetical protein HMI54_014815 [Coelomomyces lativittatus]|nr:hypothetical protein HMI54_014815 [Coelomomyces lativittatus]